MMPALIRRFALCLSLVAASCVSPQALAGVGVGEAVPSFDTRLVDGTMLRLSNLKKRPVLVAFWATWCPPCHRELIELQTLYDSYHGKGLEVIAISVDSDKGQVAEYLKARGITYPVAMNTPRHTEVFGPMLLPPRLFLIAPDGRLVLNHWGPVRMEALESTLKTMLR
jgi:peroxiredoxin